jgi:hypothetical protein
VQRSEGLLDFRGVGAFVPLYFALVFLLTGWEHGEM